MHIEPGLVTGAKLLLGAATATACLGVAARLAWDAARERGLPSLVARAALATAATFVFFQVLPHHPVGVSEVHLILGSTLFLMLGAGPAAIGLALGLLLQGMAFEPVDLPQYGMNVTTLLVPLFALSAIARRLIAPATPYVDLTYAQVLALSASYQGGIVAWVAFWAFWAEGGAALVPVATFGAAYMAVVVVEPLIDLAVLGAAKGLRGARAMGALTTPRLLHPA